jgi:hypothetical protein
MTQVSFTSTYRIPLVEQNITPAKREALKRMASGYQNVLYPNGNNGYVRVSIRKRLDSGFEQELKQIGFKVFQKFDRHNIPKTDGRMDEYIKEQLDTRNYQQFGKQMKAQNRH